MSWILRGNHVNRVEMKQIGWFWARDWKIKSPMKPVDQITNVNIVNIPKDRSINL